MEIKHEHIEMVLLAWAAEVGQAFAANAIAEEYARIGGDQLRLQPGKTWSNQQNIFHRWLKGETEQQRGKIRLLLPSILRVLPRDIRHRLSIYDTIERRALLSELQERGIHFRSLTDSIDTSTPAGRFFFHVMSALAEMERELIVERTRAGLAAAREQGRIGGRRRVMTTDVVERARRMLENGATRQQVADVTGVDVKTIYKYLPAT